MSSMLRFTRHLAKRFAPDGPPRNRKPVADVAGRPRVLLMGIYMGRETNHVDHLVDVFGSARKVTVDQRWVCMKGAPPNDKVAGVTVRILQEYEPKWLVINDLVAGEIDNYDYFLVSDDDILLGRDFVDGFIAQQQYYDFALAQPGRTWRSFTDHDIVRRRLFTRARQTNFVEGGPLVSFRRDLMKLVSPFSDESPMGWGYDLTWPVIARKHGLTVGIIDATPVDHSLRARSALYDKQKELDQMAAYLSTREHVREEEAVRPVRIYR